MANYIKREIDNFDYNDRFYVPNEHKWCFMADDEKFKKYYKEREEYFKPRKTKVQVGEGEVEITGQIGDYTGEFPGDSGDSDEPISE